MPRLVHITERAAWEAAARAGEYRMSTRGVTLEEQGFIHCSLPHQLRATAAEPDRVTDGIGWRDGVHKGVG
jgi:uncharacterized protein (DUF952 family)